MHFATVSIWFSGMKVKNAKNCSVQCIISWDFAIPSFQHESCKWRLGKNWRDELINQQISLNLRCFLMPFCGGKTLLCQQYACNFACNFVSCIARPSLVEKAYAKAAVDRWTVKTSMTEWRSRWWFQALPILTMASRLTLDGLTPSPRDAWTCVFVGNVISYHACQWRTSMRLYQFPRSLTKN